MTMLNEHLRQTGRTTNMLKDAINLNGSQPTVILMFHNLNMAQHARNMFVKLLTPTQMSQITSSYPFSITLNNTEYLFKTIQQKPQLTEYINSTTLFDHAINELI